MTDDIYGGIPEIVAARYKRISDKYIQMIAKKLKEIGSVDTSDVHALLQLSMYGNDIQKLEKEISDLSGKTAEELSAVFDKVAEKSLAAGRTVAELRGAELQPYKYNSHLQNTVEVLRQTSLDTFTNISNTTTVAVRFTDIMGNTTYKTMGDAYKDAIDDAIHSAAMGFTDYNTEISKVLRQFSESGLRVVDYESGYSRRLDSAVRQNVLDGMRSVYQGVQTEISRQLGCDGVEISAHGACAPDHLPYQGRQYSNADFEKIQDELPRPFGYWNCRHSWWGIVMGVSKPAYSEKQLREMERYSNERIEINGKTMSRYEWTQKMREIETVVRKHKDRANLYKQAGDDRARRREQSSINRLRLAYSKVADAAGLPEETDRMTVSGFRSVKVGEEMAHRVIGERGKEICPKAIYSRETKSFRKDGGIIIRGVEAKEHAEATGSSAVYIAGGSKIMYLLDDATVTEVLEENYHYLQDKRHDYGNIIDKRVAILREIDAQRHLQKIADKYKIPLDERQETANYLARLLDEAKDYGYI